MVEETETKTKSTADEVTTMTVPIRVRERPRKDRANAAINKIKEQISKNLGDVEMEKIKIGESISRAVFARGRERPPKSLKISVKKIKGKYYTELEGIEVKQKILEKKTLQQKKPQEKGLAGVLEQMKKKTGILEEKEEKPKESDGAGEKNLKKATVLGKKT